MSEKASSVVAGAKQWATYYGKFTQGEESAALTAPLRARAAWEDNNAEAFAAVFADNGSILLGDDQLNGRESIREYFTAAFGDGLAGSRLVTEPVDIKVLEPGVAVVITDGGVLYEGETTLPAERTLRSTWVTAQVDGEWRLFSQQSSPVKG